MKKYNLFLDDMRIPLDAFAYSRVPMYHKEKWVIVRDYKQFVAYIEKHGLPEIVSFDHDLADNHYNGTHPESIDYDSYDEKTGYHCVQWLIEYCLDRGGVKFPTYALHTMNTVGQTNMDRIIKNYIKNGESI